MDQLHVKVLLMFNCIYCYIIVLFFLLLLYLELIVLYSTSSVTNDYNKRQGECLPISPSGYTSLVFKDCQEVW